MKVNSQLERAQLENLTSLPASATAGRVAWDSVAGKAFLDDAANWRAFLRNDQKAIIGNSGTAADNIRFHRGASGVLQLVSGADATAEGTLSTAINQLSFRAENYATGSLPTFGSVGRIAFDTTTGFPKFDTGSAWKEIVDSTSTQTISGKTLTDPKIGASAVFADITTPSTPSAGFSKLYHKADGLYYYMNSDGVEKALDTDGAVSVSTKTANYTIVSTDGLILVDGSGGGFTVTLPTAVGITGKKFQVKRIDQTLANTVILATTSSQTIDGVTTRNLSTIYEEFTVISDGANWVIASHTYDTSYKSYNPTIVASPTSPTQGNGTWSGQWRRDGRFVEIEVFILTGTTGTAGSGDYILDLPIGIGVDTGSGGLYYNDSRTSKLGYGRVLNTANNTVYETVLNYYNVGSASLHTLQAQDDAGGSHISKTYPIGTGLFATSGAVDEYHLFLRYPVSGWEG